MECWINGMHYSISLCDFVDCDVSSILETDVVLLMTGSGCGSSFPVTMKQVCNTSILKQASLESRLGEELAFVT